MYVSVIIPSFNRAGTIARAIDSVLAQTYTDLEVIVVDDGSTDSTGAVLQRYAGRITVLSQSNAGPSAARNRGAAAAHGEILAFLDSDDVWLPTKLERQVRLLVEAGPAVACCICNTEFHAAHGPGSTSFGLVGMNLHGQAGYLLNPGEILATRFFIFNQVLAVRSDAFQQVGGFNEKLWILEDSDLALRLARLGPWAILGDPLVIKYGDTVGIGVAAEQDPLRHMLAWQEVVGRLLADGEAVQPAAWGLLQLAARDADAQIAALRLAAQKPWPRAIPGQLWLAGLRLRRALWRRSSWWPKPRIAATIHPQERGDALQLHGLHQDDTLSALN